MLRLTKEWETVTKQQYDLYDLKMGSSIIPAKLNMKIDAD